eukprot:PhM_4_TR14077/c6_g1_i1/m.60805
MGQRVVVRLKRVACQRRGAGSRCPQPLLQEGVDHVGDGVGGAARAPRVRCTWVPHVCEEVERDGVAAGEGAEVALDEDVPALTVLPLEHRHELVRRRRGNAATSAADRVLVPVRAEHFEVRREGVREHQLRVGRGVVVVRVDGLGQHNQTRPLDAAVHKELAHELARHPQLVDVRAVALPHPRVGQLRELVHDAADDVVRLARRRSPVPDVGPQRGCRFLPLRLRDVVRVSVGDPHGDARRRRRREHVLVDEDAVEVVQDRVGEPVAVAVRARRGLDVDVPLEGVDEVQRLVAEAAALAAVQRPDDLQGAVRGQRERRRRRDDVGGDRPLPRVAGLRVKHLHRRRHGHNGARLLLQHPRPDSGFGPQRLVQVLVPFPRVLGDGVDDARGRQHAPAEQTPAQDGGGGNGGLRNGRDAVVHVVVAKQLGRQHDAHVRAVHVVAAVHDDVVVRRCGADGKDALRRVQRGEHLAEEVRVGDQMVHADREHVCVRGDVPRTLQHGVGNEQRPRHEHSVGVERRVRLLHRRRRQRLLLLPPPPLLRQQRLRRRVAAHSLVHGDVEHCNVAGDEARHRRQLLRHLQPVRLVRAVAHYDNIVDAELGLLLAARPLALRGCFCRDAVQRVRDDGDGRRLSLEVVPYEYDIEWVWWWRRRGCSGGEDAVHRRRQNNNNNNGG